MRRFRKTTRPRKRAFRKKRFALRRRRLQRPKPDGIVCSKITAVYDLLNDALTGIAALNVNWAGNGIAAITGTARLTTQNEFTHMVADYNEYMVKAVKFEVVPMQSVNTAADTGFYYTESATDTSTLINETVAANTLYSLNDYKISIGNRIHKRYIRCSKYYNKHNEKWLLTSQNYSDVGTLIMLRTSGFAANAVLAKVHVTWYVYFKQMQL